MEGRYQLEGVAGTGAHAIVVFARIRGRDQRVALKVLRYEYLNDASAIARMRDEARILAPIRHPDIVRVHRLLDYGGRPVIEMEPLESLSLEVVTANHDEPLRPADAIEIVRRVAAALHAAWSGPFGDGGAPLRVVHRDVKPANILLLRDGRLKVVDFGIARGQFVGRRAKSVTTVAGSAGYSAPERKLGVPDGPATDVYALGVLLFVLATGRLLILPNDPDPEGLARQLAHLPLSALATQVERMIARDPARRPSTDEVAGALGELLVAEGLAPDLPGLAARAVAPVLDRPRRTQLQLEDLSFLETTPPSDAPAPLDAEQAYAAVRALLARPSWERRVPELERVVEAATGGYESLLLDVLDRARVPWWTPWARPSTPEEIVAALWVLGDHPSAAVRDRARELLDHADEGVRRAATFVVSR